MTSDLTRFGDAMIYCATSAFCFFSLSVDYEGTLIVLPTILEGVAVIVVFLGSLTAPP